MASHEKGGVVAWIGRILSGLIAAALLAGCVFSFLKPDEAAKGLLDHGYPKHLLIPLAIVEAVCVVLYLIPQTAVLGAILLTGYFGGAVATHVRVGENAWVIAAGLGVLLWVALIMRDRRLRALLPLRN